MNTIRNTPPPGAGSARWHRWRTNGSPSSTAAKSTGRRTNRDSSWRGWKGRKPLPADQPASAADADQTAPPPLHRYENATVEGRIELRPLAKPLHRYQDADAGIVDGANVSFANGTNPEVLLVLEARKTGQEAAEWQFGLVQTTGAAVFAELDGKEIWTRGEADPPARRDAYVNAWITPPAE